MIPFTTDKMIRKVSIAVVLKMMVAMKVSNNEGGNGGMMEVMVVMTVKLIDLIGSRSF